MDALSNGWYGLAIQELYAFDGQIHQNDTDSGIVGDTGLSITELVIQDMQVEECVYVPSGSSSKYV